jgi:nucleoside-diphosphate-sugar epimerase
MTTRSALVVGASGIIGNTLAGRLAGNGWQVHGLARRPLTALEGVTPIAADLLDTAALGHALQDVRPSHVFITTWMRQPTEIENCEINGRLIRNLLNALRTAPLEHVALVTGLKHYLGPFESYGKGNLPSTPFREEQPRLPGDNFYYTQEDEVYAAAEKQGFGWSIHRPHTVIGYAIGNAMNMGVTLAVYATICRELGRPFLFPGSPEQWNNLVDITDSRILAEQLEWAATTPAARNEAFNIVNGDVFRWRWMWSQIAAQFGIEAAPYPGHPTLLEEQMKDDAAAWADIAAKYGLRETKLDGLVSPWHTDADLGRQLECVTDMSKSRNAGFLAYQDSRRSFLDLFARLRRNKIVP